ncbi:MAG TPA: RHS repeat-associated core domain-containing protein [Thermoanaerobaculia bacterium]|nr:RHS repeat-associated core domain-containing protein [Thermoanaerobaculia bacterium]
MAETYQTTASTPAIAYEYVWFGGQPVAQFDAATNTPHWTFTDHLGTPILQTNAAGAVDWRAEYEPYGTVTTLRAGAARHQPLRFPGQEYDEVSADREYNVFRWYCGGWGRYTQADPMGFAAGPDVYAYVLGNPIDLVDAMGLVAQLVCTNNIWVGGVHLSGAAHCRVRASCLACNRFGLPASDETYGLEATGNPPYSMTTRPYPQGVENYNFSAPITHEGLSDCEFARCVKKIHNFLGKGYTGQGTAFVPAYFGLGPNSNTYAQRLIQHCGGSVTSVPYGAVGWNNDPGNPPPSPFAGSFSQMQ